MDGTNSKLSPKLTPEQEAEVWERICAKMGDGDPDPNDVIAKYYEGSRSRYCAAMAECLGLTFGTAPAKATSAT